MWEGIHEQNVLQKPSTFVIKNVDLKSAVSFYMYGITVGPKHMYCTTSLVRPPHGDHVK